MDWSTPREDPEASQRNPLRAKPNERGAAAGQETTKSQCIPAHRRNTEPRQVPALAKKFGAS